MTGLLDIDTAAREDLAPSVALVLGGGAARGLAHIGVLEVLEAEGIRPAYFAGTSIGGLVAALAARRVSASRMIELAGGFRFPRRFIPGRMLGWHEIFPTAVPLLDGLTFEDLGIPLAISAVDLQQGEEVVLHSGALLPAVRATCAVPGVLLPNPVTARFAFDVVMRAFEVALDRQRALAIGMTDPDVLIDLDLGDVSFRDFHRLAEIVEIGRRATREALPRLRGALSSPSATPARSPGDLALYIDPVCRMAVSPARARARVDLDGVSYYFCSVNCRECFERHVERYLRRPSD